MSKFRMKIRFEDRLVVDRKSDSVEDLEITVKKMRRKFE